MARPTRIEPKPGQESVWDYPRPPRIEPCSRAVLVRARDLVIARSTRALRVLETAGAPTIYVPPDDVDLDRLTVSKSRTTYCEWKGRASYFHVDAGYERIRQAAWTYRTPKGDFEALRDFISFYPAKLECFLDDERVQPQGGGFYGGWITDDIVGPFKGDPGTEGW